jgi:flagellar hook-length control protein FliK
MTITPTAPTLGLAPAVVPTGDAGAPTDGTVPGDFLALVQKALADALGGAPDSASGTPAVGTPSGPGVPGTPDGAGAASNQAGLPLTGPTGDTPAEAPADAQPDPTAAATAAAAAAAAGLSALVVPVLPAPPVGGTATPATAGPTDAPVGGVEGAATTDSSAAAGAPVAAAGSDAAGTTTRTSGHPGPDSSTASASPGGNVDGVTDAPVTAAGTGHGSQGSGEAADPGAGRQSAVQAPSAVTPTPVAGAPVSTTSAPAAAAASAAPPVSGQVFPEVTSLVSRGDGVHRITLTLKPEALGEVRVVMTVRDGAVHVRLAAGHEAQQALLQGSPELSRLLEHAGATDTRIVVRDLFGAATPTTTTDRGTDLGQGQGLDAGSSRSQDQHAGTRAEHDATDGTVTSGATSPRSAQSVTRTRTSGVDVTM